jgi:signal-transduction protein with cAMP-binding, CBS, and nucleotidyltransferase domain
LRPAHNASPQGKQKEDDMTFVRDILRDKPSTVWTIESRYFVYKALELMAEKDIGALPVTEDGKLVGMFSERDYARKVILKGKSSHSTTVGELMSQPVVSVGLDDTIETCMALMTEQRIRHLPVMDQNELVGMVSIGDVLKATIARQEVLIQDLSNYIVGARS